MAYDLNADVRGCLRSAFAARGLDEVLRAPVSALIGVYPAAEAALAARAEMRQNSRHIVALRVVFDDLAVRKAGSDRLSAAPSWPASVSRNQRNHCSAIFTSLF